MSLVPPPKTPVMHRAALLAAGVTDDEIRQSRRSGAWTSLHRGAYCSAETLAPLDDLEKYRLRAHAIAARSPHLVLSHTSAACLLGLPVSYRDLHTVHLTRIGVGGGRSGGGRAVHVAHLEPDEQVQVQGVMVTSVARTLVDLACAAATEAAVMAADFALRARLITPQELSDAMARTRHRRGGAGARRALRFADGRSESPGESVTRVVIQQVGLPVPELQVSVFDQGRSFLGRADLGYPELGVLIEFDGLVKYCKLLREGEKAEDVVVREKDRENLIRGMGYLVVRFVWSELSNPALVSARINAELERGRRIVANGGIAGTWAAKPPIRIP